MTILIIDDSPVALAVFREMLTVSGYSDIVACTSVEDAFRRMCVAGETGESCLRVDLILMDLNLPDENGISACRRLKQIERFKRIPVIIVSGNEQAERLEEAFDAGAVDYIRKPVERLELLARVRSALRLKEEMNARLRREAELLELAGRLEEANRELQRLSALDGLTGIPNRRSLDEFLDKEWKRAHRDGKSLAVIMIDIDFFKAYNDTHGHLEGDECLRKVAASLRKIFRRPGDLVGRFGGEEFAAVLSDTGIHGGLVLAEAARGAVEQLGISHGASPLGGSVTISVGVAAVIPGDIDDPAALVAAADVALYRAKQGGRNRIEAASGEAVAG